MSKLHVRSAAFGTILTLGLLFTASLAQAATITTDQADYAPGGAATITGSQFDPQQDVTLSVTGTNLDGSPATASSWDVTADDSGAFTTQYTLPDNFIPLYLVVADSTDGTVLAQTSFTDSISFNNVTVGSQTPNPVLQGSSATYSVAVTFNGSGAACSGTIGTSGLPAGATPNSPANVASNGSNSSSLTISTLNSLAAGSYPFTVSVTPSAACGGSHTAQTSPVTLVVSSPIVKTNPTLSISNSPVTYNGSAQAATVNGSVAGTVSNVKYDGSATVPTNAGTYVITADFAPTDTTHYNSLTGASAGNFVINKATPTLSVTNTPATYNAAGQSATVSGSVAGVASNILTGGAATQTNVGTYAVTADFAPTDTTNYNSLTAASAGNFVISPAGADCSSIAGGTYPYDGLPHGATGSCVGVGAETSPNGLTFGAAVTNVPGGSINWSFSNSNYVSQSGNVTVTITAVNPTCTVTGYTVTYDGNPHTASGQCDGVNGETNLATLDLSATTRTNAGTTNDAWSFTSTSGNYNNASGNVQDVINQATPVCTVTPYVVLYNALPHTAVGTLPCAGVNSETVNGAYNLTGTTHTAGGSYNDPWSFTSSNSNYSNTNGHVNDVIIAPQPPITVSNKDFKNGSTIPVKIPSSTSGWTINLKVCDLAGTNCHDAVSSGGSNSGTLFRFDATGGQYIYNLSTKGTQGFAVGTFTLWISSTGNPFVGSFKLGTITINK